MPNKEAIRQAIRVMDAAPDELVDMTSFARPLALCATARCLGGWMAADLWFQRNTDIGNALSPSGMPLLPGSKLAVAFGTLLGISSQEAQRLFLLCPGSIEPHLIPKHEVLKHLRLALDGLPIPHYGAVIAAYGPDGP